ncbi:MAG: carbohydrate-binding family 9-like protein [Armatimonadota bacterium]
MRLTVVCLLLTVTCCVWAQDGPVTIGGVTYKSIDPGEPFVEAVRPVQNWTAPAPTAAETAAGMMAYIAADPGEYRSYRLPKPTERVDRLQAFLTPGEDEAVTFGLYTLANLKGLTVDVDLNGAPVSVGIRHEHCWPQRTGWRSRQWYLTPELLLPCANGKKMVPFERGLLKETDFDLTGGQSQGIWLTLSATEGAKPGRYTGVVSVSSEGKTAVRLPLAIDILPFKLQLPTDRSWLLYADAARWTNMSDAQILAEMRDYARHGMTGFISIGLGKPDLSRLKEGKVTYDASAYRRWTVLGREAGVPGPHVINSTGVGPVRDVVAPGTDLNHGEWPEAVKAGVRAVARAAAEATRDVPRWYYYGVDEPTGENTFAIQDYQAWHDGGAPTYATFFAPSFLEKASAFLTAPCFVVGLVSAEKTAAEAREACQKTGSEFWWYGTGSYVNPFPQEGFMFNNRYGAGLLFWKTGAKAQASWTFCRPHEDVFNDFDGSRANKPEPKEQCTAYPHLLKPDDWTTYQGAIPTIAWEALREGKDDYLYLYTLTTFIKQAQASSKPGAVQAAADAQAMLDGLVTSVAWANALGPVAFETSRLQQVRRMVADCIVTLQGVLAGQGYKPSAQSGQRFDLLVRTTATPRKSALPVLTVTKAAGLPVVDGKLDEACWKTASVAGNFADIRTGEPAKLNTTARVMSDDKALYIGFDCPEPAMADVAAKVNDHDGTVWMEDGVELFIAGAARKPYAHMIVTTTNAVLDEANQDAQAWNPKLQTAVSKGSGGWSAEIAVPWPELAAAGVRREPLLTLNFGRSRFTHDDPQAHTAWSCTYNGFHVPERFGVGFMEEGPLVLTDVRLPDKWGRQKLGVTLKNISSQQADVQVSLGRRDRQMASIAPGQRATVEFPVSLHSPGERTVQLSWGLAGQTAASLALSLVVPEPVTAKVTGGLIQPGQVVELPLNVNLAPTECARYKLVVRVVGQTTTQKELSVEPGQTVRLPQCVSGPANLQVLLVNNSGRTVWASQPQPLMVLR